MARPTRPTPRLPGAKHASKNDLPPRRTPDLRKSKNSSRTKRRKINKWKQAERENQLPGISEATIEKAREMHVGFGLLQFVSQKLEEEMSSEDESLHDVEVEEPKIAAEFEETEDSNQEKTGEESGETEKQNPTERDAEQEEDFIMLEDVTDSENDDYSGISERTKSPGNEYCPWWTPSKDLEMSGTEQLNLELLDYVCYVSAQPAEKKKRESVIRRLRDAVKTLWGSAEIRVFGSSATGMYLPDADIDVVILCDELNTANRGEMYRLAAKLKSRRLTNSVQVIAHARVPIVKYVDDQTNTNVDIAFGQTSGLETVRLVKSWITEYPVLKPMGMFVRQFLKQQGLSEVPEGGIGGYAMLCMMYSRLRYVLSKFPSIFESSESKEENSVTALHNAGLLLLDFFEYYGYEFDNVQMAVRCTASFEPFPKRVNPAMKTPNSAGLAIEDPQMPSNNISKATYKYPQVKRSFEMAADALKAALLKHTGDSASSILGRLVRLEGAPLRTKVPLVSVFAVPEFEEPQAHAGTAVPRKSRNRKSQIERAKQPNRKPAKTPLSDTNRYGMDITQKTQNGNAPVAPLTRKRAFDPWDSGNPKTEKEGTPEYKRGRTREENDDNDSRVKVTTAERRQFWKDKGKLIEAKPVTE